ncbi:HAD hydrolase-like protein [Streptomyces sp. SID8379]|uniref:HAD family hydrolase n=1 Tax=unclassified Streptomyces TaxID=2593676 RepID=UPI0004758222|nr:MULTISPECIES: HAD family hydrolase [unclassified Streptomyces]MYW67976.1 HAD hydrolase-like protein [Streptomyces sp. SID8379]
MAALTDPADPASATETGAGPVVGFDLDMTLIDSRPGIRATWVALAEQTGAYVDVDLVVSRLGPPLTDEMANWFPADRIPAMTDLYREMYPTYAIEPTLPMPGVRETVAAVHAAGGRVVVVTAKYEPNAKLHLAHLGIDADVVVGDLWAEGKGAALEEHGASVYVGDHVGDVRGARTAQALSVGVTTGPCDADELRAAGADVILAGLTEFPSWLAGYVAERA